MRLGQVLEIGIYDREPCASDPLIGFVCCSAKAVGGNFRVNRASFSLGPCPHSRVGRLAYEPHLL